MSQKLHSFPDEIERFQGVVVAALSNECSCDTYIGRYLFHIENKESFILDIQCNNVAVYHLKEGPQEISANSKVRTAIFTDALTLKKLLKNQIRARIAFLTGKVKLKGDIFAFIRMVGDIKKTSAWSSLKENS